MLIQGDKWDYRKTQFNFFCLERLEGKTRNGLFFYISICQNNSVAESHSFKGSTYVLKRVFRFKVLTRSPCESVSKG